MSLLCFEAYSLSPGYDRGHANPLGTNLTKNLDQPVHLSIILQCAS